MYHPCLLCPFAQEATTCRVRMEPIFRRGEIRRKLLNGRHKNEGLPCEVNCKYIANIWYGILIINSFVSMMRTWQSWCDESFVLDNTFLSCYIFITVIAPTLWYSRTPLIRPPSESHWGGRIRGMVAREGFVYEQKPLSVTRNVVVWEGWSLVRVVVRQGFYCIAYLSHISRFQLQLP